MTALIAFARDYTVPPPDKSKENQIAFESDVQRKVNFQTHCHRDRLFPEESQTLSPSLHILISLLKEFKCRTCDT